MYKLVNTDNNKEFLLFHPQTYDPGVANPSTVLNPPGQTSSQAFLLNLSGHEGTITMTCLLLNETNDVSNGTNNDPVLTLEEQEIYFFNKIFKPSIRPEIKLVVPHREFTGSLENPRMPLDANAPNRQNLSFTLKEGI